MRIKKCLAKGSNGVVPIPCKWRASYHVDERMPGTLQKAINRPDQSYHGPSFANHLHEATLMTQLNKKNIMSLKWNTYGTNNHGYTHPFHTCIHLYGNRCLNILKRTFQKQETAHMGKNVTGHWFSCVPPPLEPREPFIVEPFVNWPGPDHPWIE